MIKVEGLNFEYGRKEVLHDINLHIKPGSITALVGPNGAGKTTLMRCIVGLEKPSAGKIFVNGMDVRKKPREVYAHLGYVSDFFGLYDGLSVKENLEYIGGYHQLHGEALTARVEEIAKRVGLSERMYQKAGALSRGYRQRLGVALTLIHAPKLLVLDEPASGMDPESRIHFSQFILSLRDAGHTLLVSSHILAELEDYCTDMLVLREGCVVEHVYLEDHARYKKREITIGLVDMTEEHLEILRKDKDLQHVQKQDEKCVVCETSCNEEELKKVLKRLLNKKLPIYQFAVHKLSLQQAYMDLAETDTEAKDV